jgi:hypothetical protein
MCRYHENAEGMQAHLDLLRFLRPEVLALADPYVRDLSQAAVSGLQRLSGGDVKGPKA